MMQNQQQQPNQQQPYQHLNHSNHIPPHLRHRYSNPVRLPSAQCTHLVIYDFDGTVYAQRFWKEAQREIRRQNISMDAYVQRLHVTAIINNGFGGNQRVERLKRHFMDLRKHSPNLAVVLLTFIEKRILKKLFDAISTELSHWFDIVLSGDSDLVRQQIDSNASWSKNAVIENLCGQTGVIAYNVLYIDDDPEIKKDVNCCSAWVVARESKRRGMTSEDMRKIVREVDTQMRGLPGPPMREHDASQMRGHLAPPHSEQAMAGYMENRGVGD